MTAHLISLVPLSDPTINKLNVIKMFFFFQPRYKRNCKGCSCATTELLCMHLGDLLNTQEVRVALGYASSNFVTILPCLVTSLLHL